MVMEIDLSVCISGKDNRLLDRLVPLFFNSLRQTCDLTHINVFILFKKHQPVSSWLNSYIKDTGFRTQEVDFCYDNCREDTSKTCDWMMDNFGTASLASISHFDVVFHSDFFQYARSCAASGAVMIGRHANGVMVIERTAYRKCGVGFLGIDNLRVMRNSGGQLRLAGIHEPDPDYREPGKENGERIISVDTGQLLELRMSTLSQHCIAFSHIDYFTHLVNGSGHSMTPDQINEMVERINR